MTKQKKFDKIQNMNELQIKQGTEHDIKSLNLMLNREVNFCVCYNSEVEHNNIIEIIPMNYTVSTDFIVSELVKKYKINNKKDIIIIVKVAGFTNTPKWERIV